MAKKRKKDPSQGRPSNLSGSARPSGSSSASAVVVAAADPLPLLEVSPSVRRNVFASLGIQALVALISGLLTDGGWLGQIVVYAIGLNAVLTVVILLRRGRAPTRGDLVALRFGFLFLVAAVGVVSWLWGLLVGGS